MRGNCLYKAGLYCFLFLIFINSIAVAQPCNCDHTILPRDTYIDGHQLGVQPGDTICIMAGKKKFLNLFNFEGTAASPVVFINCGGLVEIGDPGWHYACVIGKSYNFIFTGSGDPAYVYGISIKNTKKGVSGLAIGGSDFEVHHIEVAHTGFAGIMAKTDPNCDPASWQENYTMQNISFHHNYVHDTGGEGFYIGYTGSSKKLDCNGKEVLVNPHDIKNIKVFNNRVENAGWDGIQVSRAVSNCEIFNNTILNYGTKNDTWQKAGMVIGGGTTGKLYNNYIHTGTGGGIHVFGRGENLIYNNVIINAGEDGIFCKSPDKDHQGKYGYVMINNTIINPKRHGLKIHSLHSTANRFYNNVIIQPQRLFIAAPSGNSYWHASHNFMEADTLFLTPAQDGHSYLKDQGKDVSQWGVNADFNNNPRPYGSGYDLGAFEKK